MKKAILAVLALLTVVTLVSCSAAAGKSAYEIAVEHGFAGDEAAWLESLRGSDGRDGADGQDGRDGLVWVPEDTELPLDIRNIYDAAVAEGYTGSFLDFLADYIRLTSDTDGKNAAALGLMSAVSVYATFVYGSGDTAFLDSVSGSGVIYRLDSENGDAYVVTNYHVVYENTSSEPNGISHDIKLYLCGGKSEESVIPAVYVGGSMTYDVAVLKISGSEILKSSAARAVSFCLPDSLKTGETVYTVGNPVGDGISVTAGIVSVDSEYVSMLACDKRTDVTLRAIRVDNALNPGSSGGGLYNTAGELVGLVNARVRPDVAEGVGYAIPAEVLRLVTENILQEAARDPSRTDIHVRKCSLGVTVSANNAHLIYDSESGDVRLTETDIITAVRSKSPAKNLLFEGDIIQTVTLHGETREITRLHHLLDFLMEAVPGDTVIFGITRGDTGLSVEIPITEDCMTEVP